MRIAYLGFHPRLYRCVPFGDKRNFLSLKGMYSIASGGTRRNDHPHPSVPVRDELDPHNLIGPLQGPVHFGP